MGKKGQHRVQIQTRPRATATSDVVRIKDPHGFRVPDMVRVQRVKSGDGGYAEMPVKEGGYLAYFEETIPVARSLHDPLTKLHNRGRVDGVQYAAGRRLQALLEAAAVGHVRAQDPTREPVDTGRRVPDVMSNRQLEAIKELQTIWTLLGTDGSYLVRAVLGEGMMPEQYGKLMKAAGARAVSHWGWLFSVSMERLAKHFKLAS